MLIPALLAFDWLRRRRFSAFALVGAACAGAAMAVQRAVLGSDGRSAAFDFHPRWLISGALQNLKASDEFWANAWSPLATKLLFFAALLLIARGLWAARARISIYDLFALFYLLLIIPYTYISIRYLLPLAPALMLYLVLGLTALLRRLSPNAARAAAACAMLAIFAAYASRYAAAEPGPIREGVSDPDFVALCDYARSSTPPGSRFVARKPRVFSLLADRPAAIYNLDQEPADLLRFLQSIHASYVVWGGPPAAEYDVDALTLERFLERYPSLLTPVYSNAHYRLYRVTGQAMLQ